MFGESEFCAICGQKIIEPSFFQKISGVPTYFEFKEGKFCPGCAKYRVQKSRGVNK